MRLGVLSRLCISKDVAGATVFLAFNEMCFIAGQVLQVARGHPACTTPGIGTYGLLAQRLATEMAAGVQPPSAKPKKRAISATS